MFLCKKSRVVIGGMIIAGLTCEVVSPAFGLSLRRPRKPEIAPQTQPAPKSPLPQPWDIPPVGTSTRRSPSRDPMPNLIRKQIFPPDAATRTTPLSRAELACILVKALGHNTRLVGNFPFYRDVPQSHWAYACIEAAREKRLMDYGDRHGFYHPESPVVRADAYQAIASAITGPPPSPEATEYLLRHFPDRATLSPDLAACVAKMVRVRFFIQPGRPETEKAPLKPDEPLTTRNLAPLISQLIRLVEGRAPRQSAETEEEALPVLPGGLRMTLSPARAILEANLTVGEVVRFVLITPVGPLPKGSLFRGAVQDAQPGQRRYGLVFHEVRTPNGGLYQTDTELHITFPPRDKLGLLVQGQVFEAVSRAPVPVPAVEPKPGRKPHAPSP